MSESEGHTYKKEHQLSGEASLIDLSEEGQSLLAEARQAAQGRAARTVIKEGPLRLTLLALKQGAEVAEHRAGGPVSIQLLEGEVTIGIGQVRHWVTRSKALVLEANVVHSVAAAEDSLILLTIAIAQK
jgi:quercetin dioxygenase-like cupin family protein